MNGSVGLTFWHRLRDSLDQVSGSNGCLFLVLVALRSLVSPYWGITHDAEIYSLQVMNRATHGFFSQDLFLQYGSQDSYSAFSILVAPLAATLGLRWSFFLVYTASVALLVFAEIRLVRYLLPDRLAASVALILLAVTDLPWGGWGVFHLHESFLTARLPAVALTLLGLEQLLRKRFVGALGLMLLAMALHPLMAAGGLLVAVASVCVAKLPLRWVLPAGFTTALAGAAVLLCQPLGQCLFGHIDPEWLDIVRRRNPYSFPSGWTLSDWWWIAYSLGIVLAGAKYLRHDGVVVVRLVVLLALGALAGSVAAEACPYALLVQGQPYRGLWLLQFLAVPLGVLLVFRLWEKGTLGARASALFVLCCSCPLFPSSSPACVSIPYTVMVFVVSGVLCALVLYRARRQGGSHLGATAAWLCPSVLFVVIVLAAASPLKAGHELLACDLGEVSLIRFLCVLPRYCGDGALALGGILLVAGLWSVMKSARRIAYAAGAVWIGLSVVAFFCQEDINYWNPVTEDRRDIEFVRQFVHEHGDQPDRPPLVYWPTQPVHVWHEIPANSFFSWGQSAGVVFSRGTAIESQRRALLVRRFEIASLRKTHRADLFSAFYSPFFQAGRDEPQPTRQDLITLCKESQLDFVVLRCPFRDLAADTNGSVFIFDCRAIRAHGVAGEPVAKPAQRVAPAIRGTIRRSADCAETGRPAPKSHPA